MSFSLAKLPRTGIFPISASSIAGISHGTQYMQLFLIRKQVECLAYKTSLRFQFSFPTYKSMPITPPLSQNTQIFYEINST
jgi:hypothetical protein